MKRLISALLLLPLSLFAAFFGASIVAAQTTPTSCLVIPANLSVGSSGNSVMELQQFLKTKGFLTVTPTGYYGALTQQAVKGLQTYYALPSVGVVGPMTRAAIQFETCKITPPLLPNLPSSSTNSTSSSQATTSAASSTAPQIIVTPMTSADTPTINATSSATTTATSTVLGQATSTDGLPYHATQFGDWQAAWGSVSTTSTGALHLEGTLTNNGAEAIYPASLHWTDYKYTANVSVANGNISLISRYQDSDNFLACSFAKGWLEIDQVQDGTSTVLTSQPIDGILPGVQGITQNTTVSMTVNGDTVSCAGFGPTANLTYTFPLNTAPKSGGIGVESWYETPLADKLDLIEVQVDPL